MVPADGDCRNGRFTPSRAVRRLTGLGAPPSTLPSAAPPPGFLRGTSTRRLNSATSTPSWLSTRVCTLTVPRSGLDCDSLLLQHLGLAEQRVAVEHGRGVLELLGRQVGDRLAADVGDRHAERERVDERAHDDVAPLLGLRRVHVVEVQRVVVHRDQAEQVVVGLGHGLGGPVLVDGADLELLEVAAVGMGAARLARGLVGLDGLGLVWVSGLWGDSVSCGWVGGDRETSSPASLDSRISGGTRLTVWGPSRPPRRRPTCATPATSSSPSPSARPSRRARSPSSPPG